MDPTTETPPPATEQQTPPAAQQPPPDTGILNDPELAQTFENPFEALDTKLKVAPPEKKEEAPPATPPKVEAKKEAAPVEKPQKPTAVPKALKEHNEQLLSELRAERKQREDYERKFKEFEKKDLDTSKLAQQIAESKKEMERLQGELRASKFETTEDFKARYDKPIARLAARAKADVEQLPIIIGKDEDTGEVKTRLATWNDMLELYNMPYGLAVGHVKRLFGDNYDVVKDHLKALHDRMDEKQAALEDEKVNWQKRSQEEDAKRISEREAISEMWERVNKDISAKNPEWYGEDANDPEGNELLKEGYRLVDSAYNNPTLTPQQKVILDANIRHKAAAFGRDQHRLMKLSSRVAELEEKLNGKKASAPGAVRRDGDGGSAVPQKGILEDDELTEAFK